MELTEADFARLKGDGWLNDAVINFFVEMIKPNLAKDIFFFSSFFWTKLSAKRGDKASGWYSQVRYVNIRLLSCKFIITL